jgi:hypothetical protein
MDCGGKHEVDEDIKLRGAVQTHGGKNWVAVAALIPGRLKISVARDGMMHWSPTWTRRRHIWVNGQ